MHYLNDYSDKRLKGTCVHCGTSLQKNKINNDHVPSKCLLQQPYPEQLPVVQTCVACNNSFSKDEEYFSIFLQCVLIGSTNPDDHTNRKIRKALLRSNKLRQRIESSRSETKLNDENRIVWKPERERTNNVVLKNARGHVFYEIGKRTETDPIDVWATPLLALTDTQRQEFQGTRSNGVTGWPEVGSRAMQRVVLGDDLDDGWVIVQDNVYRYQVIHGGSIVVRSVLMEYLATQVCWSDL